MTRRAPTLRDVRAEKARRSLAEFVRQSWHVFEPETPLKWSWVLDVICEHVQALLEDRLIRDGRVIRNLVMAMHGAGVTAPKGHAFYKYVTPENELLVRVLPRKERAKNRSSRAGKTDK